MVQVAYFTGIFSRRLKFIWKTVFFSYDIGRLDRVFLRETFTLQNGAISVLFYFLGLMFSVAIADMDDKLWLFDEDSDLWDDKNVSVIL